MVAGARHAGDQIQSLQFGVITGAGGMKASLFSRMSPTGKPAGAGNTFSEVQRLARTQGSSNNLASPTIASNTASTVGAPAARLGGQNSTTNQTHARGARSPFRDAMQKGVLSGAGLLTYWLTYWTEYIEKNMKYTQTPHWICERSYAWSS